MKYIAPSIKSFGAQLYQCIALNLSASTEVVGNASNFYDFETDEIMDYE